jgi:hypothetical protein
VTENAPSSDDYKAALLALDAALDALAILAYHGRGTDEQARRARHAANQKAQAILGDRPLGPGDLRRNAPRVSWKPPPGKASRS